MDTKGVTFGEGSNEERGTFSEIKRVKEIMQKGRAFRLVKRLAAFHVRRSEENFEVFVDLKAIYVLNLVPENVI
jgi:hypothetical protein